jgi:membrane associated rhomboid family serine protease
MAMQMASAAALGAFAGGVAYAYNFGTDEDKSLGSTKLQRAVSTTMIKAAE